MNKFDAFEVHPVIDLFDNGGEYLGMEVLDESEIGMLDENDNPIVPAGWSVYGHMMNRGIECIANCPTQEIAEYIKEALNPTYLRENK
jgi:hypothetical protein